ncbi:unnamed protein product [Lactuca saligna]|uniref:Uncharacterized protein n=1 Tax=Lactuca saligna TaxID=75948 RepID=A0AA35XXZ5_LACSI|nr:unnamed protein product [Lactuca saligna]
MVGCAIVVGVYRHKLAMNSIVELTSDVVAVCASGCPSNVDRPLSSRDCIGRNGLVVSPSCPFANGGGRPAIFLLHDRKRRCCIYLSVRSSVSCCERIYP